MNNEKRVRPPRGPMRRGVVEKPKNLLSAMKRLFSELKSFRIFIIISIILAITGSILSIVAPDKLADLTDEISKGLVVNTDNLEQLTKKVTNNLKDNLNNENIQKILDIKLDEKTIYYINSSNDITSDDKQEFNLALSKISQDKSKMLSYILQMPDSTLKIVLGDSTYNGVTIKLDEKKKFIEMFENKSVNNSNIPKSILSVILNPITVDNTEISTKDQIKFLENINGITKKTTPQKIYSKIDKMPDSIKKIVEPFMNIDKVKKITLFLVILYVFSALFNYIQAIIMTNVSNKFAKRLRSQISTKINKLPLKYFDSHLSGDILSRVTNDVDMIAQSMNQSLATLVSAITLFLGTIIMMFYTNYIMAITAILSSLIGFILMFTILGKSQKYFTRRQIELGNLNGHIEEIYSNLNIVKVYNGKKQSDAKFDELNKRVYECNRKSQFLSGLMQPIMMFIGNFGYVSVCIVGAVLTMNDVITFGTIVAFITYVRLFTSPLSQIAQGMTAMQSTAAASERVFEFLDEKQMSNESDVKEYLDKDTVKGKIEFKNVKFRYDGNDEDTIKNFSAVAKPGEKIAIVGPTGAGKTTMVNLLMKFYEINSGDILIDGKSIYDLTRENVHELFTMVLQDTWVFDGTIKENIIYNKKDVSDEKVKEVCKIVGLHHFIKTLPKGYDSKLSDNDSISAGQRQLLTIARAMLNNSPFLILDEATSNVDTRTEELVQKAMDKLTKGKTSFIIAHRLSTIKNADLILVMKNGDIIESGNHKELIEKKGFYAELYNSQFEI